MEIDNPSKMFQIVCYIQLSIVSESVTMDVDCTCVRVL